MADKFADAPIGATHWGVYKEGGVGIVYYRFDGHVWKFWFVDKWKRCEDNRPSFITTPLPSRTATPPEHTLCCGTTCDKQAVNRYIKQLEAVAAAARALPVAVQSETLQIALNEVGK
jgi:hypothetical protein